MKKMLLCLMLALISIFSFTLLACGPKGGGGGPSGPVANAELDEYNQIVDQMKEVFAQVSNQPATMSLASLTSANNLNSANTKMSTKSASLYNSQELFASSNESLISGMFTMMDTDSTKKESNDMDYYAYGIDFSTMTARIAGYAANNYFKVSSFYGLNILMDYGGNTIINASVEKEDSVIKTYLFTTFKNSQNQTFKEYNYAEIQFTSQTDFNILVLDYSYDPQDNLSSQAMIYASSNKDFFLLSGDIDNPRTGMVFFDMGEASPAYVLQGEKTSTIATLFGYMSENFALSNQDKAKIGGLYNTQDYSISYERVIEAKTDLGIIIDMDDSEYVAPIGFVSNKNAEDLVGRKTLQAFVDDGESVDGTTLTIPDEFNYLSGGIYFQADIDTLVIPSTIRGIVVYDHNGSHSILDDTLCYDDEGNGRYRPWGGILTSYVLDDNGEFYSSNYKPFKKFILLDDNGEEVNETDAFVLDDMGNLWIKDSNGNKNYLWGFVSEPTGDTLYLPSPTYERINGYNIQVEHFYSGDFSEYLKNVGKLEDYTATIKHLIIDGYMSEEVPEMGIQPGFKLLRNNFLSSHDLPDGTVIGLKWNLDTLTINNIVNEASVDLSEIFSSMSYKLDEYGYPTGDMVCQTKIKKVILNGDFETITYGNGYTIYENVPPSAPEGEGGKVETVPGVGFDGPGNRPKIIGTYAISEDYELNGRENARFAYNSIVYGKKVVEIYNDDYQFPAFPDAETLLIKSSVRELNINDSFLQIGMDPMPEDRKLTIEFENIAGINFSSFEIQDFMWRDWEDPNREWKDSNRVEKLKFNCSEAYMEKFISSLEMDPSASWFVDAINSGRYIIEYGEPHPYEEEFFANFDFDGWGVVTKKESNTQTTFEINDDFLSLVKQVIGQELKCICLNDYSGAEIKVILNISKEYIDNSGVIPCVYGADIIEIASAMKEFDDLVSILDAMSPNNEAKLIFNGTKQELLDRTRGMGEEYIIRLLYIEFGYYREIVFSDNETLYRGLGNSTLTYEDARIKIVVTYVAGEKVECYFEDKLNPSVTFTSSTGNESGYDAEGNEWTISTDISIADDATYSTYEDRTIRIPNYELYITYFYRQNESGGLNHIYGSGVSSEIIKFSIFDLPPTITLS